MAGTMQKAVTLEGLQAAAPLIATKEEVEAVKKQVGEIETGGIEFAATEEVLALFQSGGEQAQ